MHTCIYACIHVHTCCSGFTTYIHASMHAYMCIHVVQDFWEFFSFLKKEGKKGGSFLKNGRVPRVLQHSA